MEEKNSEERSLINDMFKDGKHQRMTLLVIIFVQFLIIIGLIAGFVKVTMHHQDLMKELEEENTRQMMELLTETEFVTEYSIETDHQSLNTGNITVNKPN